MRLINPNIGYFENDVFEALAFSQIAQIGSVTFFSGVAPLKGALTSLELVGKTAEAQLIFVLDIIEKCLEESGLTKENIAAWTFYTTDIKQFSSFAGEILKHWLGNHKPTSTTVQVAALIHPAQTIEITVTAVK